MKIHDSLIQSEIINGYEIQFILKPRKKDINHLVVLFNGYRHHGWDFGNAINFIKCNVLFIVDVFQGNQSCYLGKEQNFCFAEIIPILIDKVLNKLCLSRYDCTLLGVSKGGFAALYIGIKYNFSNIVSSVPVANLGDWMKDYDMKIATHVMGNGFNNEIIEKYNMVLFDAIAQDVNINKKIYLFYSENDNFYFEYGQNKLIKVLVDKYRNLSRFGTFSPLASQHNQITAYFLQDILSITHLLTQNIALDKGLYCSEQNIKQPNFLDLEHEQQSMNNISFLGIKQGKLFIEGVGYIKNYHAPTVNHLHKYLLFKNIINHNEYEFLIGSTNKKEQTRELYEQVYIDYTSSGLATMNFKGINLLDIEDGTYQIKISISSRKTERDYKQLYSPKLHEGKYIFYDKEYYIFSIKSDYFMTKRSIIGRIKSDLFLITNFWCKDNIFHLEGKYAVLGMPMPEFYMGNYYLVAQKENSDVIYSHHLGQVRDKSIGDNIGDYFGNYTACYFATMHFNGINVTDWEEGIYNLYISLSVKNELFSEKVGMCLSVKNGKCEFL